MFYQYIRDDVRHACTTQVLSERNASVPWDLFLDAGGFAVHPKLGQIGGHAEINWKRASYCKKVECSTAAATLAELWTLELEGLCRRKSPHSSDHLPPSRMFSTLFDMTEFKMASWHVQRDAVARLQADSCCRALPRKLSALHHPNCRVRCTTSRSGRIGQTGRGKTQTT